MYLPVTTAAWMFPAPAAASSGLTTAPPGPCCAGDPLPVYGGEPACIRLHLSEGIFIAAADRRIPPDAWSNRVQYMSGSLAYMRAVGRLTLPLAVTTVPVASFPCRQRPCQCRKLCPALTQLYDRASFFRLMPLRETVAVPLLFTGSPEAPAGQGLRIRGLAEC